jgi:hypothetical protein
VQKWRLHRVTRAEAAAQGFESVAVVQRACLQVRAAYGDVVPGPTTSIGSLLCSAWSHNSHWLAPVLSLVPQLPLARSCAQPFPSLSDITCIPRAFYFYPEYVSRRFPRNVGTVLPDIKTTTIFAVITLTDRYPQKRTRCSVTTHGVWSNNLTCYSLTNANCSQL